MNKEFHCIIVENGTRCNKHHVEIRAEKYPGSAWICPEHQKYYAWLSVLLEGQPDDGTFAKMVANEPVGARTDELTWANRPTQIPINKSLEGWVRVSYVPEADDVLMIRQDMAKDGRAPTSEKKDRLVIPASGFAPLPKPRDPFDE